MCWFSVKHRGIYNLITSPNMLSLIICYFSESETEIIAGSPSRDGSTSSASSTKVPFSPTTQKFPKHTVQPEDAENYIVSACQLYDGSDRMLKGWHVTGGVIGGCKVTVVVL